MVKTGASPARLAGSPPPVQAGILPARLPARSAPTGVKTPPNCRACSSVAAPSHQHANPDKQKFFGSFFQKRTTFLLLCILSPPAKAADYAGFDLNLNTTVRLSLGLRTEPADASLLTQINADDGDRAFAPGPNSERVDIVTELTGERGPLGFDISAQGWYDAAYNTASSNHSPATFNPATSTNRGWPGDVRDLMGKQAELLNAYVRDTQTIANIPVTVAIGRQTLLWGESLLFTGNGIAAAQAPVDEIKSLGAPLAEARELFLPVTQIVARAALGHGFSLQAYDQLEWRADRLPGVGSFFSTTDILDAGGQRILGTGGAPALYRTADDTPHGLGQFGVALLHSDTGLDWGLYALRADARAPSVVLDSPAQSYRLAYARGTEIYGASLSTYAGDQNIAGEISLHRNTALAATTSAAPGGDDYDGGTTLNAQISTVAQLPPGHFADGASLMGELASNQLISGAPPPLRTHFALGARVVFTPTYYQVLPGLDLDAPLGGGIGLVGYSSIDQTQNAGAGFVSAELRATFHVVWIGSFSFTHFIGGAGAQPLADRDFAVFSVTRSF